MSKQRKQRVTASQLSDNEGIDENESDNHTLKKMMEMILKSQNNYQKFFDEIHQLRSENVEMKNDLRLLKADKDSLLQRIETLENAFGDWSPVSKADTGPVSNANTNVSSMVSTVTAELSSRATRTSNVVIFGMEEFIGTEAVAKEKAEIVSLVNKGLGIAEMNDADILQHYRLGNKNDDGRPRPLKIKLKSQNMRDIILASSKKLGNNPPDHKFRRIFINADLTVIERKEAAAKRQERKNRQSGHNKE